MSVRYAVSDYEPEPPFPPYEPEYSDVSEEHGISTFYSERSHMSLAARETVATLQASFKGSLCEPHDWSLFEPNDGYDAWMHSYLDDDCPEPPQDSYEWSWPTLEDDSPLQVTCYASFVAEYGISALSTAEIPPPMDIADAWDTAERLRCCAKQLRYLIAVQALEENRVFEQKRPRLRLV